MADKTVKVGTVVTFQDTSNEIAATYTWDFGDGSPIVTTKDASHVYNTVSPAGIPYSVSHTVTNTCGTTTCTPKTVEVVTELPPSDIGTTVMLASAALLGFMILSKKKQK